MATDDCGQEKTNLDQIDTEEVSHLAGWVSHIEDEENKSDSLDNINETNCCEVQIIEEDVVVDKPTKRGREEDEQSWTKVESNRGKKQKQIKKEVFIWSKEKLPKQFAIAKLFFNMGMTDINHIKYITPYKLKIEVSTEECVGKLLDCKEFQNKEWKVYSAMDVNISYGIIRDVDLELSDEEALKAIRCPNDIQIVTLKRLQRRDDTGAWVPSEVAKVGFRGSYLPAFIYVDCLCAKVEPYVFPVTQCSNCWKFGHVKARCTSKKTICPKCTEEHSNCEVKIFKCVNCRGDHMALNRICPVYAREKRVRELMAEYNCTYHVACNMYVRPKSPILQAVRDIDKPKIDNNNSFSGLLLEDSENVYKYTPSEFPPLFTQNRPKSPQASNKNKQSHSQNIGKSEWWGQRESPDCIPKQPSATDNDLGDNVNNERQKRSSFTRSRNGKSVDMKYVTMCSTLLTVISVLALSFITGCHGEQKQTDPDSYTSQMIADLWLEGADVIRIIWRDCSKKLVDVKDVIDHKEYFPKFVRCMKRKTLRALDRSLTPDVVPVADGINLVRFELVDRSGNVMPENETSSWTEKELDEGEWRTLAVQRMAKVLRTHVIKFDFDDGKTIEKVEYRGRRRHQMLTMMMFGVVSIGMVLIPMGFQFLAVLGGKALLLAKMALILASIQGLKKIASSPVNYGFYHSGYPYDYYEKRSRDDWPQPGIMPATPPPAMSVHNPWTDTEIIKRDRIHIATDKDRRSNKSPEIVTWKPELPKAVKKESEPRIYPIYAGPSDVPGSIFTSIDAPTPLADLTTRPGDVQADYAIDLPFNRFHFQSPTTVVSA